MDAAVNCEDIVTSEDRLELIVVRDEARDPIKEPICKRMVNEKYEIWYYDRRDMPPLSMEQYGYSAIPNCYGLLDSTSLEVSGILRLQNQPTLSLKGQGVFIAIPDTGVGAEDTNGHGSFMASVACGKPDPQNDFTGAAPEAELIAIKLQEAPKVLRDFYYIPENVPVYAESEIMLAVAQAKAIAAKANRPLVTCIGLGSSSGTHTGTNPLCEYLDSLAAERQQAVVVATGNEANASRHYYGQTQSMLTPDRVEINVENDMAGFTLELATLAPEIVTVAVQSPTGEIVPRGQIPAGANQTYEFLFEGTTLSIDYQNVGRARRDILIFFRFSNVKKGIWTILVYPYNIINGAFHMWLPMGELQLGNVYFLKSNPYVTLTTPSDARSVISVGGYNAANGAVYLDSGRGYTMDGNVKPDFLAPAVEVQGKNARGDYVTRTGTSAAAAITAGACAQILEWAIVRGNDVGINSVEIKNILIRGCERRSGQEYPSPINGFGNLNVYNSFDQMRGKS